MKRSLVVSGCAGLVGLALWGLVCGHRSQPLSISFVGYTNYAGVRAAVFAVTNCGIAEVSCSGYAQRRTPTGWENLYPSDGFLGAGYDGLFNVPGGQAVTFMTVVFPGAWHGAVNYTTPETKLDLARGRLSYSLKRAGVPADITRLLYHHRAPVIHSQELQS